MIARPGDVVRTRTTDGQAVEGVVVQRCNVSGEVLVRTRQGEHWCVADEIVVLHERGTL